jgi:hypothetical protein
LLESNRLAEVRAESSLFDFWAQIAPDASQHPEDRAILKRVGTSFDFRCLPSPIVGRLQNAPVVLLFLSPGLDEADVAHAATEQGRNHYADQRSGYGYLPSEEEHSSAAAWLKKIVKQFDIDYADARSAIAVLNLGAYKSKTFDDWHMLSALPSSRRALDWAQSYLFPQAMANERVVVCLRSAKYWGLDKGSTEEGHLYAPQHSRSGFMIANEMRTRVKDAVQRAVVAAKHR